MVTKLTHINIGGISKISVKAFLNFTIEFYNRMTAHRNRSLVNKTNRCTEFQFYWYYYSTCFRQPFCPSSGVLSHSSALVHFMQLQRLFATRSRMELKFTIKWTYPMPVSKTINHILKASRKLGFRNGFKATEVNVSISWQYWRYKQPHQPHPPCGRNEVFNNHEHKSQRWTQWMWTRETKYEKILFQKFIQVMELQPPPPPKKNYAVSGFDSISGRELKDQTIWNLFCAVVTTLFPVLL